MPTAQEQVPASSITTEPWRAARTESNTRPELRPAMTSPTAMHDPAEPYLLLSMEDGRPTALGTRSCILGGESGPTGRQASGVFAEWDWDGRRLEVRTDRFGFQPLFYAVDGTTLWLSASIPELLYHGAPSSFDDAALAVFLRLGVFLGNDTPFLHIRAMPPAGRLSWEDGRVTVTGSRTTVARRELRRDAAIDSYMEVFSAAMSKHSVDPARTLVPLTGGRDSRHMLLALHAAGLRVPCATVRPAPPKSEQDLVVAMAVAAALGMPHTVLETTHDRYADETEKNVRTSLCVLEHFWVMPLLRHAAGRHLTIYDGIAGDTLSEAKYMNPRRLELFRQNDLVRYAEEELTAEAYLPAILQRDVYKRFSRELALERLAAELRTHVDAPNPVGSYRFWNRTRRAIAPAPFGMLASVATIRAPFLDHDVYNFLASLPGELLVDRTFHSETIARGYPSFARLPYENPAAPEQPAVAHIRPFGVATLRREVGNGLKTHGKRARSLLRHGPYTARLVALLALPGRIRSAASLANMGLYLSQLEELGTQS